MSNISERLLEERKRLGLNQDQMAVLGSVAKRTYCNYEAGEREPMSSFFTAIALAGADVQYILTGVRSGNSLTDNELALLAGFRALDARGKAAMFGVIGGLIQPPGSVSQVFNAPVHQAAGNDINNEAKDRR
jgi:transcriptional regulator with XRE-family HTH domain